MNRTFRNLDRNHFFYSTFLRRKIMAARERSTPEELVRRIMLLARFAWRNHPGYYCDGRIENLLFDFGLNLKSYLKAGEVFDEGSAQLPEDGRISTIHVATEVCQVGGHTRILYQLVRRHGDPNQVILLTGQRHEKVPRWFRDGIGDTPLITLDPADSVFKRAALLRRLAVRAGSVLLYHHPWDAVPVIALATAENPPVVLENHAHSWFWLGASVADLVVAHSAFHTRFTQMTRPVRQVHCFPFTQLEDLGPAATAADKARARERLGIPADCVCLITVGTAEKFIPNDRYNFHVTAHRILERFSRARIYVIGTSRDERYPLDTERINYLGYLEDPADYYRAADICLDALPQPSLGATLYATLIGMACPLYKYGKVSIFNSLNFLEAGLYRRYVGQPETEEAYLERLAYLIEHPGVRTRIAAEIRQEYLALYSRERVAGNLERLFEVAGRLHHAPARLPEPSILRDEDSAEIADAGSLQDIRGSLQFFDGFYKAGEKVDLLARLVLKPSFTVEVLKLMATTLARKAQSLIAYSGKGREPYGSTDCVLSAPVPPHSGK